MGPYLYFRVLIFTVLASFTQRMSIQSACIQQWSWFKLLANFDYYLCLRINFHTSSFWVLILAAGGPYWVLISHKYGSLPQSLGSLIFLRQCERGQLPARWTAWYNNFCNRSRWAGPLQEEQSSMALVFANDQGLHHVHPSPSQSFQEVGMYPFMVANNALQFSLLVCNFFNPFVGK